VRQDVDSDDEPVGNGVTSAKSTAAGAAQASDEDDDGFIKLPAMEKKK
jgi:hypothetical protein